MLELRCVFTLVSFLILERSTNYVVSVMPMEDDNIRTAESAIRTTANTLFYILGVRKIQHNPRLHHYAVVHNYFISKTLQSYENLKEVVKLINLDKSNKTNNTTDFIALINQILNEDNVLKLQNIIMGEGGRTGYDIESEMAKLNCLKKYHAEQSKRKVERNGDSLKLQNSSLEWDSITNSSENGNNIDEKSIWSEDNILPERRIFNGKRTKIKKFPFMASIQIFGKFQCAGSIIRSDLVITAASCLQLAWNNRFYRENPSFLTVRVGSSFYEVGGENIEVLQIYFYPSYDPKYLHHNIAMMRLIRNIKMKRGKVQKIVVADKFGDYFGKVLVAGWGAYAGENKLHAAWEDKIKSSALDYYPLEECQDIYSTEYVTQQNFCAGFMSVGGGACNRDVGGPGIISGQLAGVISFGAPQCGKPDAPTVFTRLSFYTDWIEEIMEQDVEWTKKRTTLKPLSYIKHQMYGLESDENTDIQVTPFTSQRPSLAVTSSIYSPPVTDIKQNGRILHDTDEKENQLTETHSDPPEEIHTGREQSEIQQQHPEVNIEKNDTKEEKVLHENGNFNGEADTEKMIELLRFTVMDYTEITKKGYESENDPSQKQTTDNNHKHSKILPHNSERPFNKKITNTSNNEKPKYPQLLDKAEGYFEQNVTNYSNLNNNSIYPEILINTQDEPVIKNTIKLELYNPEDIENTTSIFDFTLNLDKKLENPYPKVLMLEDTEQSHKNDLLKIQAQTLQIVGNTQSQTIKPTKLISDDIQTTTPVNLNETPPLFENQQKDTQTFYQLAYTEYPIFTQMNLKFDSTLNKETTKSEETDQAAYLEPLIEAQETFTPEQKLPMNYQEEIKTAYQNIRKRQQEEEKLADLIAYQLLLSQSEEETLVQNKNKESNESSTQSRTTKGTKLDKLIYSQQAAENTNITKDIVKYKDESENQKNYVTKEDLNFKNQELLTEGNKESKLYVQTDSTLTIENINLVNSNVQIRAEENDKHDNQTIYMQVDEDFNLASSESLREDYEEDTLDHQKSILINEDRNIVTSEPFKKKNEQYNYQTYPTLVDKDKTYKEPPTNVEKEVQSYEQADSILVDENLNGVDSESLKEDQPGGTLDNQTDSKISDENTNLKNLQSPLQEAEVVPLEITKDDREHFHKLKNDPILKPENDTSLTQTQQLSKYAHKKKKPPIKCISIDCQKNFNLTQTENISQQLNVKQKYKTKNEIKPMGETVSTKVLRNNVLVNKKVFTRVLQNESETSSLKPSIIPPTLPIKDFSASSHKNISNFKDFLGPMQKKALVQREEQVLSKITNEMNAEMKKFLENNLDEAVLSLLNTPDVQGGKDDLPKDIDRRVTLLLDYEDIVDGKTATSENPGQLIKEPIYDEIKNMKQQKEEIVETINKRNRQGSKTKQSQTQLFEVPPMDEKEIEILLPLFTTPGEVKITNQKQNSTYPKNVSDELYYNIENTDTQENVSKETHNVEKFRRAMHFFTHDNHLGSIEMEADNKTEVNIKMDSEEEETIKRNILDYINI